MILGQYSESIQGAVMLMWYIAVALALLVVVSAYAVGRRVGGKEGRSLALLEAPLVMKEEALRDGVCPVCGGGSHDRILPLFGASRAICEDHG